MKCPRCAARMACINTRPMKDGGRHRRYKCPDGCGNFSSVERLGIDKRTAKPAREKPSSAKFVDALLHEFSVRNDKELAGRIGISPPVLSKIRTGKSKVGPAVIMSIHDSLGMPIDRIRNLLKATA